MRTIFFQNGPLLVTSDFVKARNRSIQLATLESVRVSRPLFLAALALSGGLVGFGLLFGDLLYVREIVFLSSVGLGFLVLAWKVGHLTIYSKLTGAKGWSVIYWVRPLRQMHSAVESALETSARSGGHKAFTLRGGGGVYHDPPHGDDDHEHEFL